MHYDSRLGSNCLGQFRNKSCFQSAKGSADFGMFDPKQLHRFQCFAFVNSWGDAMKSNHASGVAHHEI